MQEINSLYIHFPFCAHLCNYCDFYKKKAYDLKAQVEVTENYILKSIQLEQELFKKNSLRYGKIETLFIGGGTPSLWENGPHFLKNVFNQQGLSFSSQYEATLEMNPASLKESQLTEWMDFGINRFSVGVQSLDPFYLKKLDRLHSAEEALESLKVLKRLGVEFSVDLMIGLPFSQKNENRRDILRELEQIINFDPSHISVYILTVYNDYVHKNDLPKEEFIEEEYLKVSEYLSEKGYLHYEVSNFAKSGHESKHNLKYWRCQNVGAWGPSATGFAQVRSDLGLRYKWRPSEATYSLEKLDEEQLFLEKLYMGLRINQAPNIDELELNQYDQRRLQLMMQDWYETDYIEKPHWPPKLKAKGFILLDALVDELFGIEM